MTYTNMASAFLQFDQILRDIVTFKIERLMFTITIIISLLRSFHLLGIYKDFGEPLEISGKHNGTKS